jgi:hypothetical protein
MQSDVNVGATSPAGARLAALFSGTSRWWLLAALLWVLITSILLYREFLLNHVSADNSLLVWYVGAQRAAKPALTREINAQVYPFLTENFGSGLFPYRFRQREEYFMNYPLPTASFAVVSAFINKYAVAARRDFASFIKLQLIYMWIPGGVIALAILGATLGFLRDRVVALAACLSLSILAAAEHLPIHSRGLHFIWNVYFLNADNTWRSVGKMYQSVWRDVRAIPAFLLHPGPAFSPFAFEPKANFTLIFLAAFALRWSGAFRSSYGLLAAASLYEQGYGMLMALFLAAIDMIRAPQRLLNPIAMMFVCAAIVPNLIGGAFWEQIGFHSVLEVAIGACIVVGAAIVLWQRNIPGVAMMHARLAAPLAPFLSWYVRLRAPFRRMSDPVGDISLFALMWIISLLVMIPLSLISSPQQSQYYWGNIHGRLLGLGVPVLWMATIIWLLTRARMRVGEARTNLLCTIAVVGLAAVACASIGRPGDPFGRLESEISGYEGALLHRLERYDRETESYLYYGLSKSIATEQNWLWKLLPDVQLTLPPPGAARDGVREAR